MCKVICIQNKQTAMFFTIAVTGLYWRWCRHWLTTFPSLSCSFPTSAVQVRSWWVFSCFASQIIRCSSDPSSCFKSENDWWDAPPPGPEAHAHHPDPYLVLFSAIWFYIWKEDQGWCTQFWIWMWPDFVALVCCCQATTVAHFLDKYPLEETASDSWHVWV